MIDLKSVHKCDQRYAETVNDIVGGNSWSLGLYDTGDDEEVEFYFDGYSEVADCILLVWKEGETFPKEYELALPASIISEYF